jgi:hypothetical protein
MSPLSGRQNVAPGISPGSRLKYSKPRRGDRINVSSTISAISAARFAGLILCPTDPRAHARGY